MKHILTDSLTPYVSKILTLYLELLGSLRRLLRPPGALPLSPIRSLAYFQPVIDELISSPLSDSYVGYLRSKMKPFAGKKLTESMEKDSTYRVQKSADSDDG
jgi:hypothetical protein